MEAHSLFAITIHQATMLVKSHTKCIINNISWINKYSKLMKSKWIIPGKMSSRLITIMMIYTSQIVIYNKTMFMWVSHIIYMYIFRRTHITFKLINAICFKNCGIYYFCLKRNSDGSTLCYTTRLVAKGFHQRRL